MTLWLDRADHLLLKSELLVTGILEGGPDVHLMIQQNVGDYHADIVVQRPERVHCSLMQL